MGVCCDLQGAGAASLQISGDRGAGTRGEGLGPVSGRHCRPPVPEAPPGLLSPLPPSGAAALGLMFAAQPRWARPDEELRTPHSAYPGVLLPQEGAAPRRATLVHGRRSGTSFGSGSGAALGDRTSGTGTGLAEQTGSALGSEGAPESRLPPLGRGAGQVPGWGASRGSCRRLCGATPTSSSLNTKGRAAGEQGRAPQLPHQPRRDVEPESWPEALLARGSEGAPRDKPRSVVWDPWDKHPEGQTPGFDLTLSTRQHGRWGQQRGAGLEGPAPGLRASTSRMPRGDCYLWARGGKLGQAPSPACPCSAPWGSTCLRPPAPGPWA